MLSIPLRPEQTLPARSFHASCWPLVQIAWQEQPRNKGTTFTAGKRHRKNSDQKIHGDLNLGSTTCKYKKVFIGIPYPGCLLPQGSTCCDILQFTVHRRTFKETVLTQDNLPQVLLDMYVYIYIHICDDNVCIHILYICVCVHINKMVGH